MIKSSRLQINIFRCVKESDVALKCLLDIFFPDTWFFIWSFSLKQYINIKITIKGYQNYKARERRRWSRSAIIILSSICPRQITSYCPHQKTYFIDNFDKTSWGLLMLDLETVASGTHHNYRAMLSCHSHCDHIWYLRLGARPRW